MKALYKSKNIELKIKDILIPKININNDLLIKVDMAGICRTDIYVSEDLINFRDNIIIGHEFTGIIVESLNKKFKEGDRIVFNPIKDDLSMIGVDYDGCFSEYITVSSQQSIITEIKNKKLAAYVEPIAASLAPLKSKFINKNKNCAIYGKNRISALTKLVLEKNGYKNFIIIDNNDYFIEDNTFDLIIETSLNNESISFISKKLKKNGCLILKSRLPMDLSVNFYDIVRKEIILESLYYMDFNFSEKFAYENESLFSDIFGNTYHIKDWKNAFKDDKIGIKKVFFEGFS